MCYKIWHESKDLGILPSELYSVTWPLAKFYFDRGIRAWGITVDNKCNEAEMRVRASMRKAKGNVDSFAASARQVMFCRLMGLPTDSAYRAPGVVSGKKKDLPEKVSVPKSFKAPDAKRFGR